MTLIRHLFKAADDILCYKRCFMLSRNSWNAENYFGSKIEIPSPPKRPLSAYMIFCKEKRKDLIRDNPSLSSPEQIKILAKKWSLLTQEMKKPYELSARQSTQVYGEEHKKFYESLTEEQKEELARLKTKRMESRRILKIKREIRSSGIPKAPCSSYIFFLRNEVKNKPMLKPPSDFFKKAAETWKSLPEDSKKVFETQAEIDKARYVKEMKEWRAKMHSEGNEKLLQAYEDLKGKGKLADSAETKTRRKKVTEKPVKGAVGASQK